MIYLTFIAAFLLSGIAAYYAVYGLAIIFAGAFWPVVAMGSTLEFAKLVTASWLYRNWHKAPLLLKSYLTASVVVLMLLTSMGIFGFLSKSHIDTTLQSGSNSVELKILTNQENIVKERLDYLLKRAKDPASASNRLDRQIQDTQKELSEINKKKLPLLKEETKLVAEIGPIKYVADMFYGTEDGALDKAVRLVIFTIMLVFDPLAVLLLIAGNISLNNRENKKPIVDNVVREEPVLEKETDEEVVEIDKQNLTTIDQSIAEETNKVEIHLAPGVYQEEHTPSKKLEPKYDYDDPYAFREKENK
jgi:hypothetical protein